MTGWFVAALYWFASWVFLLSLTHQSGRLNGRADSLALGVVTALPGLGIAVASMMVEWWR